VDCIENKRIGGGHRQQNNLISLLTENGGVRRQIEGHRWIHRQQGDLISILLFFQNKESMLKTGQHDFLPYPPNLAFTTILSCLSQQYIASAVDTPL
jgi:hypothetical protein